jgi:hypothetical protein
MRMGYTHAHAVLPRIEHSVIQSRRSMATIGIWRRLETIGDNDSVDSKRREQHVNSR